MFSGEILEQLGAAPFLLAVLSAFWKGDEAVSDSFRGDLTEWLRRAKVTPPSRSWAVIAHSMYESYFGSKLFSAGAFFRSALLTMIAGPVFFLLLIFLIPTGIAVTDDGEILDTYLFDEFDTLTLIGLLLEILVLFALLTIFPVFISLVKARICLRHIVAGGSSVNNLLFLEFFADYLLIILYSLFTAWVLESLWIADYLESYFPLFNNIRMSWAPFFYWPSMLCITISLIFFLILLFSYSTLSALSRSMSIMRILTYALPIDSKPIRSIGVVGTILAIVILLVLRIFINIEAALMSEWQPA